MKRLGVVSHYAKQGFLIVRTNWVPSLNDPVVDKELKPVGVVKDVFGPRLIIPMSPLSLGLKIPRSTLVPFSTLAGGKKVARRPPRKERLAVKTDLQRRLEKVRLASVPAPPPGEGGERD